MPIVLKNTKIQLKIDNPLEGYSFSRFDWTGKITQLKYRDIPFSIHERPNGKLQDQYGKGFYNEFGMDTALGFEEAEIGGWFHKIGIGLLKKDSDTYDFMKKYEIKPAQFHIEHNETKLTIICKSEYCHGYAYELKKVISVLESGFEISYSLENTGKKDIINEEYNHNFLAINQDLVESNYQLKFPFQMNPKLFSSTVNPNQCVTIESNLVEWNQQPKEPFFFSDLSGSSVTNSKWELFNSSVNLGIRETTSFQTDKVNLWGWSHVISPELFFKIHLKPKKKINWRRSYEIFEIDS